jgi:plasmid stabilization system protein ParE
MRDRFDKALVRGGSIRELVSSGDGLRVAPPGGSGSPSASWVSGRPRVRPGDETASTPIETGCQSSGTSATTAPTSRGSVSTRQPSSVPVQQTGHRVAHGGTPDRPPCAARRAAPFCWGPTQCLAYLAELRACFQRLAETPALGRACDDLRPGLLRWEQGRHVVFFRRTAYGIRVIRVLYRRSSRARGAVRRRRARPRRALGTVGPEESTSTWARHSGSQKIRPPTSGK